MSDINLLVIEDNRLLREGIQEMIGKQPNFNVQTAPGNGENVIKLIDDQKTDVLLMDIGLPKQQQDVLGLLLSLKEQFPELKIIIMGLIPKQDEIIELIETGVSGFVLKDATLEDFLGTIRSVAQGEKVLPNTMTKSLFSIIVDHGIKQYGASKLIETVRMTRREQEVVALIADGLSNKEIADKLSLSTYTVKSHVHNILEKMALTTRVQIAIYAHTNYDSSVTAKNTPPSDN